MPAPPHPPRDWVVGVDFGGPARLSEQRRKIVAIAAERVDRGHYRVAAGGFNAPVASGKVPGRTGRELADALRTDMPRALVGFDFPFSIPASLLDSPDFAALADRPEAFGSWRAFNDHIGAQGLLGNTDYQSFRAWRQSSAFWLRRETDEAAKGQPPLKHLYQAMFNMTLLGNALLWDLARDGAYTIDPFDHPTSDAGHAIEVYPGGTMRRLGRADYKSEPMAAIACIRKYGEIRGIHLDVDDAILERCCTWGMTTRRRDPDVADAMVALWISVLHQEGHAERMPESPKAVEREGGMWMVRAPE